MRVIDFFKEVRVELGKVVWPSRAKTIQLTVLVIFVTILVGFFIGILDLGLAKLAEVLINR